MSEQKRGKKRSKSYYVKCAAGGKKMKKTNFIGAGMKGFLVTCNKYEREAVREMYNLLNEYADVMYGPELDNTATKPAENSDSDSDEEDMEKAMAKETSAIKQASMCERRFQNTDTKCNNVIFIRTTVDDPCRLAHEIFQDIQDKQVQKARYAIRILPVAAICTPVAKDIEQTLRTVLAPHFETDFGVGISYTAACKIRNNNSVSKNMILPVLGKIIKEMNPLHRLCHDEPDLVIIAEVIQKACCFSVVKDYFKFRKYNLHEIIKKPTADETCDIENKDKAVEGDIKGNAEREEDVDTKEDHDKDNENRNEDIVEVVQEKEQETLEDTGSGHTVETQVEKDCAETSDKKKGLDEDCIIVESEESELVEEGSSIESKKEKNDETIICIE